MVYGVAVIGVIVLAMFNEWNDRRLHRKTMKDLDILLGRDD